MLVGQILVWTLSGHRSVCISQEDGQTFLIDESWTGSRECPEGSEEEQIAWAEESGHTILDNKDFWLMLGNKEISIENPSDWT